MAALLDPFTLRRLLRWMEQYRATQGVAPTYADLEAGGFLKELTREAVRTGVMEEFYVTLTNGSVVKVLKVKVCKPPLLPGNEL